MAKLKVARMTEWRSLSPVLATFRLVPNNGHSFAPYESGQYVALRRELCRLSKRVVDQNGRAHYYPDVDEHGQPRLGPVTHAYSIASAPFETEQRGHLEFYIVLEATRHYGNGRLSGSLFEADRTGDDRVMYVNHVAGNFTLKERVNGSHPNVLMIGTGTGLAPFVSMIKQVDYEARKGKSPDLRFTLIHTNRTLPELAYHDELRAIEAAGRFDFVYVPTVSRPDPGNEEPGVGQGRANNVLRSIFGMPLKEEEALQAALSTGADPLRARAELAKATPPILPKHVSAEGLRKRLDPRSTVILTCGNPSSMADINHVADAHGIRFEKEDW
jgi:ferredoxin-NADP reductase